MCNGSVTNKTGTSQAENNQAGIRPVQEVGNNNERANIPPVGPNERLDVHNRPVANGLLGRSDRSIGSIERLQVQGRDALLEEKRDMLFGSEVSAHLEGSDNRATKVEGKIKDFPRPVKRSNFFSHFRKETPAQKDIRTHDEFVNRAYFRLESLNPNKEEFNRAVDCLNRMRPEIREKFVALLAAEEVAVKSGQGVSLEKWNELFGSEEIPYKIVIGQNTDVDWQFIPLPGYIRGVEMDKLANNQVALAWDTYADVNHIHAISESILRGGLRLDDWGGWTGSPNEGRHRSSAGYSMAADMGLHSSLWRFPVNTDSMGWLG